MAESLLWEKHGLFLLLTQAGCLSLHHCSSEPEVRIERNCCSLQARPALPSRAQPTPISSNATVTVNESWAEIYCLALGWKRSICHLWQSRKDSIKCQINFHLSHCSTSSGISGVGNHSQHLGLSDGGVAGQLFPGTCSTPWSRGVLYLQWEHISSSTMCRKSGGRLASQVRLPVWMADAILRLQSKHLLETERTQWTQQAQAKNKEKQS